MSLTGSGVLYLVNDSLESLGIVHGQVGEHLAVDLYSGFVNQAHELGVGEIFEACGGIDTLYPESAEVALFLLAVAIGVCQTFLPGIFGDGPDVAAATVVTACEFQYFFSFCT